MSTIIERMQMFADGRRHLWEKKITERKYHDENPVALPKAKKNNVSVVDNFRTSEGKQAYSRRQEQQAISRWWKQEHTDCLEQQEQIETEESSIELGPEIIEGNA